MAARYWLCCNCTSYVPRRFPCSIVIPTAARTIESTQDETEIIASRDLLLQRMKKESNAIESDGVERRPAASGARQK